MRRAGILGSPQLPESRRPRARKIGDVIYFQGGTAFNDAVAAAFSIILKKSIVVPPHNGVIGAIGMALIARDRMLASAREQPDFEDSICGG